MLRRLQISSAAGGLRGCRVPEEKMGSESSHSSSRRVIGGAVALSLTLSGCVSAPKMDANAPIEKRRAFLGTSYEQNEEPIDLGDMREKLEREPEAAEELAGYGAFATTAMILAVAGGALVGWPLGQAIVGKEDPLWVLAGVGGGLIAVSIPFAIVADNKLGNAVDAHNRRVGRPPGMDAARPVWVASQPSICRVSEERPSMTAAGSGLH
jgi:hypothetical protein